MHRNKGCSNKDAQNETVRAYVGYISFPYIPQGNYVYIHRSLDHTALPPRTGTSVYSPPQNFLADNLLDIENRESLGDICILPSKKQKLRLVPWR